MAPKPNLKVATGVLLDVETVTVTTVAKGAFGSRQVATTEVAMAEAGVTATVAELNAKGLLKGRIVFGLNARRGIAVTRRVEPDEADQSPEDLLTARLGNIDGGLVAHKEAIKLPSGPHLSLVGCERDLAKQLIAGLKGTRPSQMRLAPLTPALLQMASVAKSSPRRWRTEIRVLVGEAEALAIMAYSGRTVASRLFEIRHAASKRCIESALFSLMTYAREQLGLGEVDGVMLHMTDTGDGLFEALAESCEVEVIEGPPLTADGHSASYALGLAGIKDKSGAADLLRDLRPPAGFRQNFPVKATALLLLVMLGPAWMQYDKAAQLDRKSAQLELKTKSHVKRVGIGLEELRKSHELYKTEVSTARAFIAERVFWTDLLLEMPEVLPERGQLTDFDGRDSVEYPRKKKAAKSSTKGRQLKLSAKIDMPSDAVSPPGVNILTQALKQSRVFNRDLGRITGANVRLVPSPSGSYARVDIICLKGGN